MSVLVLEKNVSIQEGVSVRERELLISEWVLVLESGVGIGEGCL